MSKPTTETQLSRNMCLAHISQFPSTETMKQFIFESATASDEQRGFLLKEELSTFISARSSSFRNIGKNYIPTTEEEKELLVGIYGESLTQLSNTSILFSIINILKNESPTENKEFTHLQICILFEEAQRRMDAGTKKAREDERK